MTKSVFLDNIADESVPISRFDNGEADLIFSEVRVSGLKVVVNNSIPACVLLAPERYKEMAEIVEDWFLLTLAEERMKNDTGETHSFEEILAKDGLTFADLEAMEDVEIE